MANISGASLAQIQQRLRDTPAYHPFDADTFCDWAMEAGDIVTVRRGDESYQSPIHSSHLVWRGKQNMELNASGTKERDAIARVSKQKYARGGYGMRQQKSLYYEFYSEDGYLHSQFELNEEHMRSEFEDVANSLRGEFEVTASHLRTEFEDANNGLRSEFEVTASHLRTEFEDTSNSLRSSIEAEAGRIGLVVEGYGPDATVKRAQLILAINNGKSSAHIDADEVYIGSQKSTTVISGKLEASDITADLIAAKISAITAVEAHSIHSDANIGAEGSMTASDFYIGTPGETTADDRVSNAIKDLQIVQNGNTYTLQKKDFMDADWVDVDSFSRAVASWVVTAGSGDVTITANPQNDAKTVHVGQGNYTESGGVYTGSIMVYTQYDPDDGWSGGIDTGATYRVDASGVISTAKAETGLVFDTENNQVSRAYSSDIKTASYVAGLSLAYNSTTHKYEATGTASARYSSGGSVHSIEMDSTSTTSGTEAYVAGQNSVNCSKGTWSGGKLTVSPSAGTGTSATIALTKANATWSGNTATVRIWDGSTSASSGGLDTGYDVTVDASARYNAGWSDANKKVVIPASSATGSSIAVKYPNATVGGQSTVTYTLSTDNSYAYLKVGSTTVARVSNTAYAGGWTGCYNTVGLDSTTAYTIPAGSSITVYAQAKKNSGDSAKTNVASRTLSAPADTNRSLKTSSGTNYSGDLTNGIYYGLFNAGSSTPINSWYVPSAWFFSGDSKPSGATTQWELTGSDYYLWMEYVGANGRLGVPIGASAWHITTGGSGSGATLEWGGVDTNTPASSLILNNTGQAYPITNPSVTLWFLVRAKDSAGTQLDAKYVGVKTNISTSHSPTIDNVWTSSSIPSGATELKSLKTQYEAAKSDSDNFCIRVDCNGTKKTYYCTP